MIKINEIAYNGWDHCISMENGQIRIIITTDVGPRIIYCGPVDLSVNVFHQFAGEQGLAGGKEWHSFGGHRMWHSPQAGFRPNQPDNSKVPFEIHGNYVELNVPEEPATKVQKQFLVTMAENKPSAAVRHRIYNRGLWPITMSSWAMSVMHAEGKVILPIPQKQTPDYWPNFTISYWPWTIPNDPRFVIGKKYLTLQQDPSNSDWFKIAYPNTEGWGAWLYNGYLFVKMYPFDEKSQYPDFGSSFAIYTDKDMTELESMGPLNTVEPGAYTEHTEEWCLFRDIKPPATEEEIAESIEKPILDIMRK